VCVVREEEGADRCGKAFVKDGHASTCNRKRTASPLDNPSFFRTAALSGRRYVPDVLSGKMDVFQRVFPRSIETGIDPQPFATAPNCFLSSADCFFGMRTKCQAAVPCQRKIFDRTVYSVFLMKNA